MLFPTLLPHTSHHLQFCTYKWHWFVLCCARAREFRWMCVCANKCGFDCAQQCWIVNALLSMPYIYVLRTEMNGGIIKTENGNFFIFTWMRCESKRFIGVSLMVFHYTLLIFCLHSTHPVEYFSSVSLVFQHWLLLYYYLYLLLLLLLLCCSLSIVA